MPIKYQLHIGPLETYNYCGVRIWGFVNYSINWNQIFLGKQQTNCTLWVKANNDQHYSKVIFALLLLSNLKYQSVIEIHDLTSKPCVLALPSIPIRNLEWRNGQLYEPYNEFKIELKEVLIKIILI